MQTEFSLKLYAFGLRLATQKPSSHSVLFASNIKMHPFKQSETRLIEEIVIPPSSLGDIRGAVHVKLRQMYIDMSCPHLGIGINISAVRVDNITIDPNSGECIAKVIFTLEHVIPTLGQIIARPSDECQKLKTGEVLHIVSFGEHTSEKVAIGFRGTANQYEITLCQYVDHSACGSDQLPLDPSIRFVCIAEAHKNA